MELVVAGALVGILLLGRVLRERIEGHPAIVALLLAGAVWMAFEWFMAPPGRRIYPIVLTGCYLWGAWYQWKRHREGRWTAFSVRDRGRQS